MTVPQKIKNRITYDPAIPLLGIYSKELKAESQRDTCTPMFRAALLKTPKTWKKPNCPLREGWLSKMWCIHTHTHTMEYIYVYIHTQ